MTEKYFAATPFTRHNQYLEKHIIMLRAIGNCIMAYGWIMLKLKDFEGIMPLLIKSNRIFWVIQTSD